MIPCEKRHSPPSSQTDTITDVHPVQHPAEKPLRHQDDRHHGGHAQDHAPEVEMPHSGTVLNDVTALSGPASFRRRLYVLPPLDNFRTVTRRLPETR